MLQSCTLRNALYQHVRSMGKRHQPKPKKGSLEDLKPSQITHTRYKKFIRKGNVTITDDKRLSSKKKKKKKRQ
jgi:hypothetical protein